MAIPFQKVACGPPTTGRKKIRYMGRAELRWDSVPLRGQVAPSKPCPKEGKAWWKVNSMNAPERQRIATSLPEQQQPTCLGLGSCSEPIEVLARCQRSPCIISTIPAKSIATRTAKAIDERRHMLTDGIEEIQLRVTGGRQIKCDRRCRVEGVRVILH